MYEYYNANPHGNYVNDCVIRSISLAEGKTWDETYEELSDIAQKNGIILDDVNFVEPLLDSRYDRECYNYITVGDFADEHPKGIYLITMLGHITCCIDGTIIDSFDCRDRLMTCAWFVRY